MEQKEYRICRGSIPPDQKHRCGDHILFAEILVEQLVVLTLADGIGSLHHDHEASKTACAGFVESFASAEQTDLCLRFEKALKEADKAVSDPPDPEMKGMMCTFIGVVWDMKLNRILYDSIGDSRLFKHTSTGLERISTDDKKAVIIRDKSGKLISQNGVLVVREGLTNALGYHGAKIMVKTAEFGVGESLVLSSDGMYELPDFEKQMLDVLKNSDLDAALERFVRKNKELFNDDASVLILQRTSLPDHAIGILHKAVNEGIACSDLMLPEHLVSRWMMDEFMQLIRQKDRPALEKMTEYTIRYDLKLSESFIHSAIDEMKRCEFMNTLFYNLLIAQLKRLRW